MSRNRSFLHSLLFALLVLGWTAPAAQAVFVPSGLSPGDEYHIAFISEQTRNGSSTDIGDYNFFVSSQARLSDLTFGVNFFAVASTETVDAVDNIGSSTAPIYLLNDTLLANGTADLWDGTIENQFRIDQSGNVVNPEDTDVFTGSAFNGTAFPGQWLGSASANPRQGQIFFTGPEWISNNNNEAANFFSRYYAISEVLTVIPEPGTALLLGLGLTGLAAVGHSRRRATRETV